MNQTDKYDRSIELKQITQSTAQNNVYHNAKKLLKIYSKTAWETSGKYADVLNSFSDEYGVNDIKGLEIIASFSDTSETLKLSDRLLSVGENKLIIEVINSALIKLREYPHLGELYYEIIYKNYFVKFKYTESEILERLCLSRATYYRRRKEAINLFGISLWQLTIPKVLNIINHVDAFLRQN